jgi:hypothetical protein
MKSIKLLVLFIFAVLLLSNVSYSQNGIPGGPGRHEALGSNPFILDPVIDLNNNPAWGGQYKDYFFANIGRQNAGNGYDILADQWAGVNFGIGQKKEMNLGLVLNKTEDRWSSFNDVSGFSTLGFSEPILPIKILFGINSPSMNLAIAPYYRAWSQDSNTTNGTFQTTKSWTTSSLGAQVGGLFKMQSNWIEGAIDFKMNSFKYDEQNTGGVNSTNLIEKEGGVQLDVFARGWFVANQNAKVKIVPFVKFGVYSWNPKVTQTPVAFTQILPTFSYMNLMGGIGVNMPVLESGIFATGLSFGYNSTEVKIADATNFDGKTTNFILPKFNIGLEWKFVDWLTGRVGYSRSFVNGSYKETGNTTATPPVAYTNEWKRSRSDDAVQTITTGLGLEFGRFCLDGMIGEQVFQNGGYLLMGNKNDLYGVLSASYNFGK